MNECLKIKTCQELLIEGYDHTLSFLEIEMVSKLSLSHCNVKQLKAQFIGQLQLLNNSQIMSSSIDYLSHL